MRRLGFFVMSSLLLVEMAACGGSSKGHLGDGGTGGNGGGSNHGGNAQGGSGGGGNLLGGGSPSSSGSDSISSDAGPACATAKASGSLTPVYLAVAFDVSGSMGKGDKPWHDKTLKWDPVVAAMKSFFTDSASAGLTASLTFFPAASSACTAPYNTPDVAMTALPSPAFGLAIDAVTPQTSADWRGGTPTLAVTKGTIAFAQAQMAKQAGKYVFVLVTDGYPEGCSTADNSIDAVAAAVQGVAATIPTYVIGVKNPAISGAPDTVSNLNAVAVAGGTEKAYIIDTGDPVATSSAFKTTIDSIRGASVSCNLAIPTPPDGRTFDKQSVVVKYTSGTTVNALSYDATCAGTSGWHYDDAKAPTQIVLCPSTCGVVQADTNASMDVEFTCEPVINIPPS